MIDEEFIDAIIGVHCFFNDKKKVALWFQTKNLNFGGCSPEELMLKGRAHKVAKFVNNALDENKPSLNKKSNDD